MTMMMTIMMMMMMMCIDSGICERLRCHLSSLWLEVIVVTLTLLSSLAITGELLVRFDILKGQ